MKITDISWGITTCPREKDTFEAVRIHLEYLMPGIFFRVFDDSDMLGIVNNWTSAAKSLLDEGREYVCILQDDFLFRDDIVSHIEAIEFKDGDGYYNLFTAEQPGLVDGLQPGWNRVDTAEVWGAMWLMRSDVVDRMLADGGFLDMIYGRTSGIDYTVDRWMHSEGLARWVHSPSLSLHIGHTSTLRHGFVKTHV